MITREEYGLLKEYREQGYKWIARDKDGRLYVYLETPIKSSAVWNGMRIIREEHFTFIKWEDEKPTKIDDLIRDYESHQEIVGENVKVKVPQFVADWIESRKNIYTLKGLFSSDHMPESVESWIACDNEKCELMAKAWIYGYEVEKEKRYILKFSNGQYLYSCDLGMTDESLACKLTQAEIEAVDPRLMQFAVEVE